MTIWVKGILLEPSYQTILNKTNGNQAVVDSVKDGFGANELGLLGLDISLPILIIGAALLSVILLLYSTYRLNKRIKI